jgi:hypothetical protein
MASALFLSQVPWPASVLSDLIFSNSFLTWCVPDALQGGIFRSCLLLATVEWSWIWPSISRAYIGTVISDVLTQTTDHLLHIPALLFDGIIEIDHLSKAFESTYQRESE